MELSTGKDGVVLESTHLETTEIDGEGGEETGTPTPVSATALTAWIYALAHMRAVTSVTMSSWQAARLRADMAEKADADAEEQRKPEELTDLQKELEYLLISAGQMWAAVESGVSV